MIDDELREEREQGHCADCNAYNDMNALFGMHEGIMDALEARQTREEDGDKDKDNDGGASTTDSATFHNLFTALRSNVEEIGPRHAMCCKCGSNYQTKRCEWKLEDKSQCKHYACGDHWRTYGLMEFEDESFLGRIGCDCHVPEIDAHSQKMHDEFWISYFQNREPDYVASSQKTREQE